MFTWISRPLALSLVLSACVPASPSIFTSPRTTPVLQGAVNISLPRGYCIDRQAGREDGDTAVIVMGKCRQDNDAAPAILTTAIGPAGSGQVLSGGGAALAAYFTSDAGRGALSRNGRAAAVTIVQAKMVGPAFVMRIRDSAVGQYWRGVESVAGRLVTVTVDVPDAAQTDGEALLLQALSLMRDANPAQ
jgi:hypothetical protein